MSLHEFVGKFNVERSFVDEAEECIRSNAGTSEAPPCEHAGLRLDYALLRPLLLHVLGSTTRDSAFFRRFFVMFVDIWVSSQAGAARACHATLHLVISSIRQSNVFANFDLFVNSFGTVLTDILDNEGQHARCSHHPTAPPNRYRFLASFIVAKLENHKFLRPTVVAIFRIPLINFLSSIFLAVVLQVALGPTPCEEFRHLIESLVPVLGEHEADVILSTVQLYHYLNADSSSTLTAEVPGVMRRGQSLLALVLKDADIADALSVPVNVHLSTYMDYFKSRDHDCSYDASAFLYKHPVTFLTIPSTKQKFQDVKKTWNLDTLKNLRIMIECGSQSLSDFERLVANWTHAMPLDALSDYWKIQVHLRGHERAEQMLSESQPRLSIKPRLLLIQLQANFGYSYECILSKYDRLIEQHAGEAKVVISLARYLDQIVHSKQLHLSFSKRCVTEYLRASFSYNRMKTPIIVRILTITIEVAKRNSSEMKSMISEVLNSSAHILRYHIRSAVFYLASLLRFKNVFITELASALIRSIIEHFPNTCFWYLLSIQEDGQCFGLENVGLGGHASLWRQYMDFCDNMMRLQNHSEHHIAGWVRSLDGHEFSVTAPVDRFLGLKQTIYDERHFISLRKATSFFDIMKSLQRPIKMWFLCRDGSKVPLLFKHNDELRKDNRVLDFFAHFGILRKSITFRKVLKVYSAIPLSESLGIIEWVEGVETLRSIVQTIQKRRGNEIDFLKCKKVASLGAEGLQILQKQYPPVLHLVLLENFLSSSDWLVSKLSFSSSCAAISLLGFCIGLGDRHTENMLIDINTGACIHVDYSCLFDRAKHFQVPELVPFRMTQNIQRIVSIGYNHSNCFEQYGVQAASLTKKYATELCGMLDSLIFDPLIELRKGSLKLDEAKMGHFVRARMLGMYDGENSTNSELVFFKELVSIASSADNLSKMYFGWAPFI